MMHFACNKQCPCEFLWNAVWASLGNTPSKPADFSYELLWNTSDIGLRGDLRSTTLGLLSFGVLLAGCGEEENASESDPGVLSWRAVWGVVGDFLRGTSKEPVLLSNSVEWQSKWEHRHKNQQKIHLLQLMQKKKKRKKDIGSSESKSIHPASLSFNSWSIRAIDVLVGDNIHCVECIFSLSIC
jgi:hypothetical protein